MVIVSSGAGIHGSPLSGGYAGAKRTQMFVAAYLRRAGEARGLGIRFVALAPRQLIAGTRIGEAAAVAYGAEIGESADGYMRRRFPVALDAAGVARSILAIADGAEHRDATLLTVTGAGLEVM